MPFSLSISQGAELTSLDEMILIFVVCGRFTSFFERKQIEPMLGFPGKTLSLIFSLFFSYLAVAVLLGFTLVFANPTYYSLEISLVLIAYSTIFLFISMAISLLLKNSTINLLILSFLYLGPSIYALTNTGISQELSSTAIAISSLSPLSAIIMYSVGTYSNALLNDLTMYFLGSTGLILLASVVFRYVDAV